jgi:hypothetical protein
MFATSFLEHPTFCVRPVVLVSLFRRILPILATVSGKNPDHKCQIGGGRQNPDQAAKTWESYTRMRQIRLPRGGTARSGRARSGGHEAVEGERGTVARGNGARGNGA